MAFIPHRYLILAGLATIIAIPAQAKNNEAADSLKAQIMQADATFFDAFNRCDIDKMASMFSPQLEFYHDTGGVTDYEQTMEALRSVSACSGSDPNAKARYCENLFDKRFWCHSAGTAYVLP